MLKGSRTLTPPRALETSTKMSTSLSLSNIYCSLSPSLLLSFSAHKAEVEMLFEWCKVEQLSGENLHRYSLTESTEEGEVTSRC